ncbi:MAG: hypothetical protein ACYSUY_09400 [Planctomycetota bacterium]
MCGTRNESLLGEITVLVAICCCALPAQGLWVNGRRKVSHSSSTTVLPLVQKCIKSLLG